eukprot:2322691-Pleurochrysis_carterae.AAC.1
MFLCSRINLSVRASPNKNIGAVAPWQAALWYPRVAQNGEMWGDMGRYKWYSIIKIMNFTRAFLKFVPSIQVRQYFVKLR